ncbi:MAG: hypothetical protein WC587_00790 [Candidatus Paceibacterota bacterium]
MIFKKFEKHISLFILFSILGGFLFFIEPRKTEAVAGATGGMVYCVAGLKATAAAATAGLAEYGTKKATSVPADTTLAAEVTGTAGAAGGKLDTFANCLKQHVLTPVYRMIAKMIIREISKGIIDWINRGFEGNPIFVQDPSAFLNDVANQASGAFIKQLGMEGLLCSQFRPQLLFSLKYNAAPGMERFRCTLGDAVRNWEGFMNDFNQGGWSSWLKVTTEPQNNPWGTYLMAQDEIAQREAAAQDRQKMELSWGSGFLSLKKCSEGTTSQEDACITVCDNSVGNYGEEDEDWNQCHEECMADEMSATESCDASGGQMLNTTPGTLISDQIKGALGSELRQLEVAKEIDEIIAALVNQLWKMGVSGLAGHSSSGSAGEDVATLENKRAGTIKNINDSLQLEEDYKNIKAKSVAELENGKSSVMTKLGELQSRYQERINLTNQIQTGLANGTIMLPQNYTLVSADTLQAEMNNASTTYIGTLNNFDSQRLVIKDEINTVDDLILKLEALRDRAYIADSTSSLTDVDLEFSVLAISLNIDSTSAILENYNIKSQVDNTIKQIQDAIDVNNVKIQELNDILLKCQIPSGFNCRI